MTSEDLNTSKWNNNGTDVKVQDKCNKYHPGDLYTHDTFCMSDWLPFDAKIIWLTSQKVTGSSFYQSIFPLNLANKLPPSCMMILSIYLRRKKFFKSEISYENVSSK